MQIKKLKPSTLYFKVGLLYNSIPKIKASIDLLRSYYIASCIPMSSSPNIYKVWIDYLSFHSIVIFSLGWKRVLKVFLYFSLNSSKEISLEIKLLLSNK